MKINYKSYQHWLKEWLKTSTLKKIKSQVFENPEDQVINEYIFRTQAGQPGIKP